jgi:radical SAM superfamily enzyme YgiQ (UPF0313 family)
MKLPKYFEYATNISTDNEKNLTPLGMLYLIGNSKYKIDFVDNRIHKFDYKTLCQRLSNYDIVGFGGTIFEIKESRKMSSELMKKGITTLYGGPNATANWNLYINMFNIIFRGEGEQVFDKIIENLDQLKSCGFTLIGNTYVNKDVFRNTNIDSLKFPDRSVININDYNRKEISYLADCDPVDTIVSSRGCPFDCYFCSSKYIWERKYSYRSIDNLMHEIEFLIKNYGTKGLYFREDNFTVKKDRVIEFCDKIIKYNIPWLCESRVDTLDEEVVSKMALAGCRGIWFGIENADNKVLKLIGKGTSVEQIKSTINMCNKHGLRTGGGFMLGFPFDTKSSILKNYKNSKKLNLSVTFYNRVWAIPVSQMYYEVLNQNLDYYTFENIILPSTKYLSADQVNQLYYKLVSRRYIIDKKLQKIFGKKFIDFIKLKLPKLIIIYRSIMNLSNN